MEVSLVEMKQKFYGFLNDYYLDKARQKPLTEDSYAGLIDELRAAKDKAKSKAAKSSHEKHLLQRYEIITVGKVARLVLKKKLQRVGDQQPAVVYLPTFEQLFDLVHETHTRCGHGGIQMTYKAINGWDVPRIAVELYLKCCENCALKVKIDYFSVNNSATNYPIN